MIVSTIMAGQNIFFHSIFCGFSTDCSLKFSKKILLLPKPQLPIWLAWLRFSTNTILNVQTDLQTLNGHKSASILQAYVSCLKTQKQQLHLVKIKNNFLYFVLNYFFCLHVNRAGRKPVRAGHSALRNRPSWNTRARQKPTGDNDHQSMTTATIVNLVIFNMAARLLSTN